MISISHWGIFQLKEGWYWEDVGVGFHIDKYGNRDMACNCPYIPEVFRK